MSLKEKLAILGQVVSSVEKQFGKGAIMRIDPKQKRCSIPVISTGSFSLNRALGIKGYPKGRIIEIYGPESSGKSTLALHAVNECQKSGGVAAYIDAEHALDTNYAQDLGIRLDQMLLSQPDTGEQGLEIVDLLARSGAVDLVVIDSVAALIPQAELEGEMGDRHMGLHARLMSQALRKLVGNVANTQTTVIFINQIRYKIGVTFGSPETTTGGNALKFFASIRLDIRRIGSIKEKDKIVGNQTRVKVVKNKLSSPFQEALFEIRYGKGIHFEGEIVDLCAEHDIIQKHGAWYRYQDDSLGHGREKTCQALRDNTKLCEELEKKLIEKLSPPDKISETQKTPNDTKQSQAEIDTKIQKKKGKKAA